MTEMVMSIFPSSLDLNCPKIFRFSPRIHRRMFSAEESFGYPSDIQIDLLMVLTSAPMSILKLSFNHSRLSVMKVCWRQLHRWRKPSQLLLLFLKDWLGKCQLSACCLYSFLFLFYTLRQSMVCIHMWDISFQVLIIFLLCEMLHRHSVGHFKLWNDADTFSHLSTEN